MASTEEGVGDNSEPAAEPDFAPSGKLAAETNTYKVCSMYATHAAITEEECSLCGCGLSLIGCGHQLQRACGGKDTQDKVAAVRLQGGGDST